MIKYELLYSIYSLWFWEISKNTLVGDQQPPNDLFLSRPFRVPAKEPLTKNSVKIAYLTNVDCP